MDEEEAIQPIFADEHLLRLLQLQTRRSLSERWNAEAIIENDEGEAEEAPPEPFPRVPAKWRLVPQGIVLHGWQRECLGKWLPEGRGTVKVATGGGKTLFALAAAEALQNKSVPDLCLVVVVPTIPLLAQWHDELLRGNVPASSIGLLGGGAPAPEMDRIRVLLCVMNSARVKLPKLIRGAKWANKMMLVVDECHRAGADQAKRIFESKPRFTLGLSATPERDGEDEGIPSDVAYAKSAAGQGLGPIIFEFSLKESLDAGLIAPFEIWHVGLPLSSNERVLYDKLSREISDLRKALQARHRAGGFRLGFIVWCQSQANGARGAGADAMRFIALTSQRKRLVYSAEARGQATLAILREATMDIESRSIVFHESIEATETVYLAAEAEGLPVVLEHSKLPASLRVENLSAFRRGVARTMVSVKSLIEGLNVPSTDLGVIAASSSKERQRIQTLGRMLRRKEGGKVARIIVLYSAKTTDEAIYETVNWDSVLGAEKNLYFEWNAAEGMDWQKSLRNVDGPPRRYLPPSMEIDVAKLEIGDLYPGKRDGVDVKLDQANNLRGADGLGLFAVSKEQAQAISNFNTSRKAHRTNAGHLVVWSSGNDDSEWIFLGSLEEASADPFPDKIRYKMSYSKGRREIELKVSGGWIRAKGPETSSDPKKGVMRDSLLVWIACLERDRNTKVTELWWSPSHRKYWIEIEGMQDIYQGEASELEFRV